MKLPFFSRKAEPETPSGKKPSRKSLSRVSKATRGAWGGSETSRLVSSWFTQGTPINQEIESSLTALRTRSRDLAKNSDYIRRFFQMAKSNVVGPHGFKFTSQVMRSNGKADEPARYAVEKGWKEFSKKGVPCAQDRLSLWDIQNLAVESLFRDGEVILLQYSGPNENRFGISYKFVDPQALDVSHKGEHGGNPVKMGIETDSRGRVIAYHFKSTDTTHKAYYEVGGKGAVRVEAKNVIHRFLIEYADQIRGVPHLAAAMFRLKMLDEYESAELVAARLAASTMGFIERGEDGGSFEGVNAVGDYEEDFDDYPEEPTIEAEAGAFHYIENGAKIHEWSGNHTPAAYGAFVKGILRGIASSLGVSYNSLANDLEGVNYSSIRQAVLEDRDFWKAVQNWIIENILEEIFSRWLESALLRGVLTMPNGNTLNPSNIDRYLNHTFTGRRWTWVDPLKDVTANEKAIQLKIRSRSSIIREQGDDPAEVWQEIAEEDELLKSLGISTSLEEPKETPPNEQTEPNGEADSSN